INLLKMSEEDVLSHNFSVSFVASIWKIFSSLFSGSCLRVYRSEDFQDPYLFFSKISSECVTILEIVPSVLNSYLEMIDRGFKKISLENIRGILLTGERVSTRLVNQFQKEYSNILINAYGQSECSDDTLHYIISNGCGNKNIPIGNPSFNTKVYVLNKQLRLQPIGFPGDLYISGDCLSLGYLNDPEKTNQMFIENIFEKGKMMFKTGDIARVTIEGFIEYIGRSDHQVKVRGNRVELGEIESCILALENIKDVRVVVTNRADEDYLTAFVTLVDKKSKTLENIRENLSIVLPNYMIPSHFIPLDHFPLLPNGKVNRIALQNFSFNETREIEMPKDNVEQVVANIAQDLFNLNVISLNDNFIDLGGHSLKATLFLHLLQKEFNVKIGIAQFFGAKDLRELAEIVKRASKIRNKSISVYQNEHENYPLSPAQKRLFVLSNYEGIGLAYNLPLAWIVHGDIELTKLQNSIDQIVLRQSSLRTTVQLEDGVPYQKTNNNFKVRIETIENESKDTKIDEIINSFIKQIDLYKLP
ncbi:MAG: AMP-binding enzyme domain protein, partial [Neobacillus sp.]|nr:AMP-binding enzyme domain protein [Neobacillus sp.]